MRHHTGEDAGPPDRSKLGYEQLARRVGQADRPHSQERVGFVGQSQVRDCLVAPDICQANDHRSIWPERGQDAPVGSDLLYLGRRGLAPHEEELGSEQANALCPGLQRPRRIVGRADVGDQEYPLPVRGGGGAVPQRGGRLAPYRQGSPSALEQDLLGGLRVEDQQPGFAVQDRAIGLPVQRLRGTGGLKEAGHANDGRDGQAARQDDGVSGA